MRAFTLAVLVAVSSFSFLTPNVFGQQVGRAAVAVRVDVGKLLEHDLIQSAASGDNLPISGKEQEIVKDITTISAVVAAPPALDPSAAATINFYVSMTFKTAEAAQAAYREAQEDEDFGEKVQIGGVEYLRGQTPGGPIVFVRMSGDKIEVGSKPYLIDAQRHPSDNLLSCAKGLPAAPIRLALDVEAVQPLIKQGMAMAGEEAAMAAPYVALLEKVTAAGLAIDPTGQQMLKLHVTGSDAAAITPIEEQLKGLIQMGRIFAQSAPEPGLQKLAVNLLDGIRVEPNGPTLSVSVAKPDGLEEALMAAISQAQSAAGGVVDLNSGKQLAIGIHNFHDTFRGLPFNHPGDQWPIHKDLGWRVAVLPYVEQQPLYDRINRKAAWDAPDNKAFSEETPEVFQTGSGGVFSFVQSDVKGFADVKDGASATVMLIENRNGFGSPWTKPESISIDDAWRAVQSLDDGDSLVAVFYDGSVQRLTNAVSAELLRNLLTPNDGNIVDFDELDAAVSTR